MEISDSHRKRMASWFDHAADSAAPTRPAVERAAGVRTGQLLGKCRIERALGQGGMGVVYLARHLTLDLPVAVKVLPPEFAKRFPSVAERFVREGRLAARIRHPNVVSIMDADQDAASGLLYLVMEYVEGGAVSERIAGGPMDEREALRIISQAAAGLKAAHDLGIVHRDVKPANLLIAMDGTVKVADLGLAKETSAAGVGPTMTSAALGTPHYMSPEQIRDAREIDHRSDVYSLGATLYHLLTGEAPYADLPVFSVLTRAIEQDPPDPRARRRGLSEAASRLCLAMMARDRERRIGGMGEVLEAIRTWNVRIPTPAVRRVKRAPIWAWWGVAAVVMSAAMAFGILSKGGSPDGGGAPTAPTRPPIADGLVLALGFEEGAYFEAGGERRVTDGSGRGNHGTVHGAVVADGRVGKGIRFDGVDDFVSLPAIRERAVASWVRLDRPGQTGWFDGGTSDVAHRGFEIGAYEPGGIGRGTWTAPGVWLGFWQIDAAVPFGDIADGWRHVVVSWDGARGVAICVDGQRLPGHVVIDAEDGQGPLGEQPFSLPAVPSPDDEQGTWLGRLRAPFWGNGSAWFAGTLDEVAVWDRALKQEEAALLFAAASRGESYCGGPTPAK